MTGIANSSPQPNLVPASTLHYPHAHYPMPHPLVTVISFNTYRVLAVCTYVFLLALSYVYVRAGMSAAQLHAMSAVRLPLV